MKIFKEYEKEYEDVYTSAGALQALNPEIISNSLGLTNFQYIKKLQDFWREMYIAIFDKLVRFVWLKDKFLYNKSKVLKRDRLSKKRFWTMTASRHFAVFCKNIVWMDFQSITLTQQLIRMASYFETFFPRFETNDPFSDPEYYKFPYEHITPDFLLVVYQMQERLKLLEIAEKRKMSYAKFLDYIINYVNCYNDDKWRKVYVFRRENAHFAPYVSCLSKHKNYIIWKN